MTTTFEGLNTIPVAELRIKLETAGRLTNAKRVVLDWFEALSRGRLDDAFNLMNPDGRYWVLRKRVTVTNLQFSEIFTEACEVNFESGIVFNIGAMTEEAGQIAVVAGGSAVLSGSGKPYDNLYHYLITVDGSLIQDVCEFADTYRSAQAFAPPGEGVG